MTEERGTYHLHDVDPDRSDDEPERIGDILHQLIDERGWPPLRGVTPADGNHQGADVPRHGDA